MPTQTALLSVSDKTGLLDFARALAARGVALLSSGGTAKALADAGIPVETVESYTGSPEVMAGRVKTLHPRVHGGILSRGAIDDADLARIGGRTIDFVIVNLYPFERTVADPASSHEHIVENIDIGGPSMVRSAAKNHARVTVLCDPADYGRVLEALAAGGEVPQALRSELAAKAFAHTAAYDAAISGYLSSARAEGGGAAGAPGAQFSRYLTLPFERAYGLRYGENPHQQGAFYVERNAPAGSLARAESLGAGGKELSFNNLVDVEAALDAVREFDRPAAVVVKHTNPCGVAIGASIEAAYRTAREADALSAFGGIVALNREVDVATARVLAETFLECVVAPGFVPGALDILRTKKNLRLLSTGAWLGADHAALQYKRVGGGLVVQTRDATAAAEVTRGKVASRRAPTPEELASMEFAWRVCKHVKSNAIVLAQGERTVGIGAGQMSRVVSVQLACEKAGALSKGSVLASDAYFPFPDGLEAAAKAGVTAVAQPGGSVKDPDVIAAADAHGLAMVFTGVRHFRH
ncbi:MAG TPA: bifunctional phosphoribosylaminoimidazolecarboxamide formyltransferase/IMP cyclohydrolase [Polyangiaceae bacterium]|jgi:phosphoribosylaminoimidazolecarboxamide formyltransferase/IMP cyclohydrolase